MSPHSLALGSPATDSTGFYGPDSVAWRVLTAPAVALMIAQITNLLEVPHLDFQSVLMDHDPLFASNEQQAAVRWYLGARDADWLGQLRRQRASA